MANLDAKRLASICIELSNKATDPDGFVPIRKLAQAFGAEINATPLLVEGMVLAPKNSSAGWLVLIDPEKTGYDANGFPEESSERPLSTRARFTLAHELAHILGFRSSEFGVDFTPRKKVIPKQDLINQVEETTDHLSSLLLISEAAIEAELSRTSGRVSLVQLCEARRRWAVSRETLVSRLNHFHLTDEHSLRYKTAARNIIVGIGEWSGKEAAMLPEWPRTFVNLDAGLSPYFVLGHGAQSLERMKETFRTPDFCLNGGPSPDCTGQMPVGTKANPQGESVSARISVEEVPRRKGARFLYLITT